MSGGSASDPYSALRISAYRFYASASMVAILGQQIQGVAIGWDLYRKTGSTMVLGWVGLLQAIPVMALAIPAGQLADRFNRRKILLISQFASIATSFGLIACALTGAPVSAYLALLFFDAAANAIGWPARSSILPSLVPADTLPNAITWHSSFNHLARVIGPAIGGVILLKSVTAAYFVDLFSGIWYVACLLMIRTGRQQISKDPVSLRSLLAGLDFVWRQKIIFATITLDLFAVLLGGAVYLLPAVAKDILHVDGLGFGILRAAPAAGAIVMGLILAHLPPMRNAGKTMLYAVAGFGIATIVFGLSRNIWLSFAALLLTGALDQVSVIIRHTLIQVLTPDEMRGRVSAVNGVFIGASNELGGFESGLTAKLFGVTASIIAGGFGTILVVFGTDRLFPQVRRLGSLTDTKSLQQVANPA